MYSGIGPLSKCCYCDTNIDYCNTDLKCSIDTCAFPTCSLVSNNAHLKFDSNDSRIVTFSDLVLFY